MQNNQETMENAVSDDEILGEGAFASNTGNGVTSVSARYSFGTYFRGVTAKYIHRGLLRLTPANHQTDHKP